MIRLSVVLLTIMGFAQASLASDGYFASVEREKWILDLFKDNPGWVMLQTDGDHSWAYFPILVKARCAVTEVRYSVDSAALDKVFPLMPCDMSSPAALPETGSPPISIFAAELAPPLAETVSVQVTFSDGSKSDILTYAACGLGDRSVCSRLVD